ncbi:hypothetical protein JS756_07300 [Streptomyces actuosus]|uniref:Ricin B lectin domain-containing protein n=1 Tax=Streptomyces actuosus TaxID=1885 RepID=A0ABS2VLD8_STRAS|nr:hypothetical protein [Streptomyces actuosus]MBN0043919.1 hypothetical protein [Streptomyces actuosus]
MTFGAKALGGALAAGAAAVILAAGPAAAGTDVYVDTTDPWNSAAAGFHAYGEIFTVCDNRADGMRASGHIGWLDSKASHWVPLEDANGANNSCARLDLEIPEGKTVTVEICVKDGAKGTPKYCAIKRGVA